MPVAALLLAISLGSGETNPQEKGSILSPGPVAILIPMPSQPDWREDLFLCAIPAAATLSQGKPIVVAVDLDDPWRPELLDFLRRLQPGRVLWFGPKASPPPEPVAGSWQWLEADSLESAAVLLSELAWASSAGMVLFDTEDRGAALCASALAGRLKFPLFPCGERQISPQVVNRMQALGCREAIFIGKRKPPKAEGLRVTTLTDAVAVLRWQVKKEMNVHHFYLVNPEEKVAGRNRHLSLVAPLLATCGNGAVIPLALQTVWKKRYPAGEILPKAPQGAASSSAGWRQGSLTVAGSTVTFLSGRDPHSGRWWMQLDRNLDGRYHGAQERPIHTGEDFEFGGNLWTANLDADEKARGQALWCTSPPVSQIRNELEPFHRSTSSALESLCLIGWPEAIPMAVIAPGQGIDADLVSDLPYAQTDEDPFFEYGVCRFLAADLASATLQACRGWAKKDFSDQEWQHRFATAEWEGVSQLNLKGAGLQYQGHWKPAEEKAMPSSWQEAGFLIHASHASWLEMGKTYRWDSSNLLPPALVDSAGCSTASLDQDPQRRSVAAQLLRNGAVAFAGNTRRGIAQQNLFRTELWHALLRGENLGQAQRRAANRLLVAVMERNQQQAGPYFYQLYNHAVYGDPALQFSMPAKIHDIPARVVRKGSKVTVHGPSRWQRYSWQPLGEWGCSFDTLYTWRGAGVGVESTWYNPEKRNQETQVFTVELHTKHGYDQIQPVGEVPAPLGWTGFLFVDQHVDGSRSLYWRVRFLDGEMTSGKIKAQVDRLRFRLEK
ncbi:MAG: hypothetical protein DWQ01_19600 [Planctomycetota bacterium]|nr:MAG: hypothetical protein DWQ01_19600 [Planctomycetota bacterium]